jgi:hypothetical protein
MLWLDIPFQIMNFVLYGIVSETVKQAGFDSSVLTRLFCGVTCGVFSAAVTCPVDVCKTRIIARDKAATAAAAAVAAAATTATLSSVAVDTTVSSVTAESDVLVGSIDTKAIENINEVLEIDYSGNVIDGLVLEGLPRNPSENAVASSAPAPVTVNNSNVLVELVNIFREEGLGTLFSGIQQRLLYVGLANGIRLAAYGTSRLDLIMRSLDDI